MLSKLGVSVAREIKLSYGSLHVVKVNSQKSMTNVISDLKNSDLVEYAEPNFIYKMQVRMFFTWGIPVLMIGSAPVHFLFNHERWKLLLMMMVFCFIWGMILNVIWNKALQSYNSASS